MHLRHTYTHTPIYNFGNLLMKIKFTTAIKENACLGQFNLVDEAESQQLVFKGS